MFLVSSFAALCSLSTLLGAVEAQNSSLLSSTTEPPRNSVVSSSLSPLPSEFSSLSTEPSSTSPGSSLTSFPASSASLGPPVATSGFSRIGNVLKPTITSYTFDPLPTPSESSIPKNFPETYPHDPPPVGDSVIPNFGPAWAAAYSKAREKIQSLTLEEKVNITTGVGWMNGPCVGNTPPVGDFPGLCLGDSPLGVRFADYVTAFPAGINTAATWNRKLMRERGKAMGSEFVGKGVNIALGPAMNMGRLAQGGRIWESFGGDPFLAGETAYETILGLQKSGVQACAKHWINNEQEHARQQSTSQVDDRTQHEIYAHPFLRSVMAGVAAIMCSYNLINDTYACENDKLMNGVLKREFGFQGQILSDWSATESTISAITGLDMTMPGDIQFDSGDSFFGGNLTAYVNNGTIPEARVDDMAIRILAGWYFLGQDSGYPETNFNSWFPLDDTKNKHLDVRDDHWKVVREIATASIVLLKNTGDALPLNKPRKIAVIGSDAAPPTRGPNGFADRGGSDGILAMGWGSGTTDFTYLISPIEAIQARAGRDGTAINWYFDDFNLGDAQNVARGTDAAIVFIKSDSGEEYLTVDGNVGDRKNLTAWANGDNLVNAVASVHKNTIIVVNSVGPLNVEPWIDNPNVTAVLWAGLGGSEAGNGIKDVLYGDYNPSGRLPYTIARNNTDYPAHLVLDSWTPNHPIVIPYTEGLLIDYRWFDAKQIIPRFEFGFGLSYTTFEYSNLGIEKLRYSQQFAEEAVWESGETPSTNATGASRAIWLHRPAYRVTFDVQNVGDVAGAETPQLYLEFPAPSGEPPQTLKGFTNVALGPGETQQAEITISKYDLSYWDVVGQGWKKPDGEIGVRISQSSRKVRLRGSI
ncbi:beta-glucosidase [Thelephora ganbajun]|uniref:Beta-glucosidase n=1 Tax=Thelephora ganbajun TaxID=370292 RepID=A0ACB6ZK07_THEGA|nr:beta-glucosidase [Thelephora ganbajun]